MNIHDLIGLVEKENQESISKAIENLDRNMNQISEVFGDVNKDEIYDMEQVINRVAEMQLHYIALAMTLDVLFDDKDNSNKIMERCEKIRAIVNQYMIKPETKVYS